MILNGLLKVERYICLHSVIFIIAAYPCHFIQFLTIPVRN